MISEEVYKEITSKSMIRLIAKTRGMARLLFFPASVLCLQCRETEMETVNTLHIDPDHCWYSCNLVSAFGNFLLPTKVIISND